MADSVGEKRIRCSTGRMTLSLGLSLLSAAVVASCLLLFVVDVAGTVTPGETFGCGAGANFAHVSPILCPVAKIRVCWNVTGTDAGKELVLRAEAAVTGYASLGLMDRSFLGPVDLFTVFVDEAGQPRVLDQHIDGFTPWVHTDIENDAQQDLVVVDGAVKAFTDSSDSGHVKGLTYTSVTIRRPMVTGDSTEDRAIESGKEAGFIWMTSKTSKPVEVGDGFNVPSDGYKYPNGNKGTWRVTFDDTESQLTCEYYCQLQQTVCGDSQERESQYTSEEECLERCGKYLRESAWTEGDIQVDHASQTLACRINAAHQAENAPAEDDAMRQELCDTSGPTGNGVCGTQCENFCAHAVPNCGDFSTSAECLAVCEAGFVGSEEPKVVVRDNRYGSASFPFYNTAACRAVHASLAYDFGPSMPSQVRTGASYRCPLASPTTSTACRNSTKPTCSHYCETVLTSCTGPRSQFGDLEECLEWCSSDSAGLEAGELTDTGGGYTLGCLTYIAASATNDSLCSAAKTGGSICPSTANAVAPAPAPLGDYGANQAGGEVDPYGSTVYGEEARSSTAKKSDDIVVILGAAIGCAGFLAAVALIMNYRSKRRQRISGMGVGGCLGIPQPSLEPQKFVDLSEVKPM